VYTLNKWVAPTNAYSDNGSLAYAETDLAEQEYDGYTFPGIEGSETIDKIFVRLQEIRSVTSVLQGDNSASVSYVKVYDGSTWNSYQVSGDVFAVTTVNDESLTSLSGNAANSTHAVDVTAFINNAAKLKDIKVRLLFDVVSASVGITIKWSVDFVSVLVCYHYSDSIPVSRGAAKTRKQVNTEALETLQVLKETLS
jgi:hypothetical protein